MASWADPFSGLLQSVGDPNLVDLRKRADVEPSDKDMSAWPKRADGSQKGLGFFGVIKRPDGAVSFDAIHKPRTWPNVGGRV